MTTMHKITRVIGIFVAILLAGCVTSVDETLPYPQLPEITVATQFNLVVSPSHPSAYLPTKPIAAGEQLQVIGTDKDAAWLLVLHNNLLGWMPTVYSGSNVGTLQAALVVDPLSEQCAQYLSATMTPDAAWTSDTAGSVIVQGSIYRPQAGAQFTEAALALRIDGGGTVAGADYVHTPLTADSALILFAFALNQVQPGSQLTFALSNPANEPLAFQAIFFRNACPDDLDTTKSEFVDQLPIGETRVAVGEQASRPSGAAAAPTEEPSTTTPTGPAEGEVRAEILSLRAGPGFAYPASGEKLRGEKLTLFGRLCDAPGSYDWFLVETQPNKTGWLPGTVDLVAAQNTEQLTCRTAPPTPPTPVSTQIVLQRTEPGSELITDTQKFAEYALAIGRYRLAEKAALALPNSAAVSQLPDYAHGSALAAVQAAVRQLKARRLTAELTVDQLDVKLVLGFHNGTASALVEEEHALVTRRPLTDGMQLGDTTRYVGPVVYSLAYYQGQWKVGNVVLLGDPERGEMVEAANLPDGQAAPTTSLTAISTILAEASVYQGTIGTLTPPVDVSAFVKAPAMVIEGQVAENTRLEQAAGPYTVRGGVTIAPGVTLFIEPGAILKFTDDAHLNVDGALIAQGTAERPIVFTSIKDDASGGDTNGDGGASAPAAGDWTMIRFHDSSSDVNSIIEHAVIRYAGEHGGNRYGAIHLEAAAPTLVNNTIEDAFWYAISADVHSFPVVSGNTLARNVGNGLEVRSGAMTSSGAWHNTDMAYAVLGPITVNEGAMLTIEPGVVVKLGNDSFFDVFGAFQAAGTADDKITFTSLKDDAVGGDTNGDQGSSAPAAGDWTMIRLRDPSNDANSVVENAVIRYAGEHNGTRFGAIHLEGASPTIANNTIEDNFWYAISGDVHSFPVVSGNTLTRNVGNGLEMRSGAMAVSGVWRNTDIVYAVLAPITINDGVTLALDPGVVVKLGDNSFFDVFGAFKAVGAPDKQITFTSLRDDAVGGDTNGDQGSSAPAPGDWTMIRLRDSSNDANSIIENAIIRYAGEHNGNRFGAIHLEAASPSITNNTIEDCFWYAVSGDVGSFPTVSGNELQRNIGNGLEIRTGAMAVSGTWRNTDIAYTLLGPVTINEGATLILAPGVIVKLGDNTYFDVFGAFKAVGTEDDPITFTSLKDDTVGGDTNNDQTSSVPAAGDWTYIGFKDKSNDANSVIEHAVIRYAGEHSGNRFGAIHLEGASPTIANNTIADSFWYAISGDVHSFPAVSGNELLGNIGNGLEIRTGALAASGTWRNTDIVYAVLGPVTVKEGATLTLEPGVVVKLGDNAYFDIFGAFKAVGTADNKITFTSLKDDTVGGDTNNDQASNAPAPGDWTYIGFKNSSNDANSIIEHTLIRYAGEHNGTRHGAIRLEGASPSITNNTIEDSFAYGIWYDATSAPQLGDNQFQNNPEGDVIQAQ